MYQSATCERPPLLARRSRGAHARRPLELRRAPGWPRCRLHARCTCIREYTSARIREHTSVHVRSSSGLVGRDSDRMLPAPPLAVSSKVSTLSVLIRYWSAQGQHTSAYVSIRQHTSVLRAASYGSIRQHTSVLLAAMPPACSLHLRMRAAISCRSEPASFRSSMSAFCCCCCCC